MGPNYKIAVGIMSGTSMDGIDAVLAKISDDFSFEILGNHCLSYPIEVRNKLLQMANNNANTQDICFFDFVVGKLIAQCVNELLAKLNIKTEQVDFIASHGQTVFHMPESKEIAGVKTGSTLQIGNISVISGLTGITTVGDFRSKDIAFGGQGAPLVPFVDEIIFKKDKNRAIQNIGGIGNVTILSNVCDTFAFDTGVGNMLIDGAMQRLFGLPYDKDGVIASQGVVDNIWLNSLLEEKYYSLKPPKSTGRELFNDEYLSNILKTAPENKQDTIATLTALTAKTIVNAYFDFIYPKTSIDEIVIGGGGAFNKTLLTFISDYTKLPVKTHLDFGINDKLKEALAFAILGFCTLDKKFNNLPVCTGAEKSCIMGVVSYV